MKTLVTGAAGFIGFHLVRRLLDRGEEVVGIDNINDYYDVRLKHGRLAELGVVAPAEGDTAEVRSRLNPRFRFMRIDLEDAAALNALFAAERFDRVCNLAAQAGVRYSLTNPHAYIGSNITGFLNLLEAVRLHPVSHLVYASSSSVYGIDPLMPFAEATAADHPASLYAVSKRSNELMAHSYAHLYAVPATGLRFFTVYGPWGRPDMALFLFTRAIINGEPIQVFNHGEMQRDFTYVDDIIEGVVRVLDRPPAPHPDWDGRSGGVSPAPWRVYNIGNGAPVRLMDFIAALEREIGRPAQRVMLPMQPGDVPATWADCTALERDVGYRPNTAVDHGIARFVAWYRDFYGAE